MTFHFFVQSIYMPICCVAAGVLATLIVGRYADRREPDPPDRGGIPPDHTPLHQIETELDLADNQQEIRRRRPR